MGEVYTEMKTYIVDMQCDCGGFMRPTDEANMLNPPQYKHKCECCGGIAYYPIQYPCQELRSVGNEPR